MKALACPHCSAKIERYWQNPICKDQFMGRCPECKRQVSLGNNDGKTGTQSKEKTQRKKKVSGRGKAASASSAGAQRNDSFSGKRSVPSGSDSQQSGKRTGVRSALADFFGF